MHGRRCSRTIEARWFWPGHEPETLQIGTGNDPRCRLCYRGPPLPGELRAINPMSGAKRAAGDPCRTKSCSPQLGPHIRSRRRPERFGMGFVSRAARRRTQPTMPPPKRRLRKRDLQSGSDTLRATSRKQKATCGEGGNVDHPAHSSPLRPLRPEPRKIPNAVS